MARFSITAAAAIASLGATLLALPALADILLVRQNSPSTLPVYLIWGALPAECEGHYECNRLGGMRIPTIAELLALKAEMATSLTSIKASNTEWQTTTKSQMEKHITESISNITPELHAKLVAEAAKLAEKNVLDKLRANGIIK